MAEMSKFERKMIAIEEAKLAEMKKQTSWLEMIADETQNLAIATGFQQCNCVSKEDVVMAVRDANA